MPCAEHYAPSAVAIATNFILHECASLRSIFLNIFIQKNITMRVVIFSNSQVVQHEFEQLSLTFLMRLLLTFLVEGYSPLHLGCRENLFPQLSSYRFFLCSFLLQELGLECYLFLQFLLTRD